MSQRGFLGLLNGFTELFTAIITSAGAADQYKIAATGADGKFDMSLMPSGLGAQTIAATASETLGAGKFVNFWSDGGTFSARMADNSNGRPAHGFVLAEALITTTATVYPLDGVNSSLTGLTVASDYFLGTAGGVVTTPLNETTEAGTGKISQYLGKAKSATELITNDATPVIL